MTECNTCKGRMQLRRRERRDGQIKEIYQCADCRRIMVTVYPFEPEPQGA